MLELTDFYGAPRQVMGYLPRIAGFGVGYDPGLVWDVYKSQEASRRSDTYRRVEAAMEQVEDLLGKVAPLVAQAEELAYDAPVGGQRTLQQIVGERDNLLKAREQVHSLYGQLQQGEDKQQGRDGTAWLPQNEPFFSDSARIAQQAEQLARAAASTSNVGRLQALIVSLEQQIASDQQARAAAEQAQINALRAAEDAEAQRRAEAQARADSLAAAEAERIAEAQARADALASAREQAERDAALRVSELDQRRLESDDRRYQLEMALAQGQQQFLQQQAAADAARRAAQDERDARMEEIRLALEIAAKAPSMLPQQAQQPQAFAYGVPQSYAYGQQAPSYDMSIYAGWAGQQAAPSPYAQAPYSSYTQGQGGGGFPPLVASREVFGYAPSGVGSSNPAFDKADANVTYYMAARDQARAQGDAEGAAFYEGELRKAEAARRQATQGGDAGGGALSSLASILDKAGEPAANLIAAATGRSRVPEPSPSSGPGVGGALLGVGLAIGLGVLVSKALK